MSYSTLQMVRTLASIIVLFPKSTKIVHSLRIVGCFYLIILFLLTSWITSRDKILLIYYLGIHGVQYLKERITS